MSAPDNVVDALADLVEADGVVNARVWAEDAPAGATKPYVTILDAISAVPALRGDSATLRIDRQVQCSLWEDLDKEDPDVARALWAALDGQVVELANGERIRFHVESAPRLVEESDNIVQRALTIRTKHTTALI